MTNFTASGHQLVTRQRNGKDGRSVSKVDVVYQRSTSATSVPTTWVTTAPKLPKGYYLWSATKVTYKEADGKTTTEVIGAQCITSADNVNYPETKDFGDFLPISFKLKIITIWRK